MIYFEFITIFIILLHGLLMSIDEFYFHHKRKLPRWERIGHPVDTAFFLGCFWVVLFLPMTNSTMILFFILAILSSLIIIKDEFIHTKCCNITEQYLHALLFVFHPILLVLLFLTWPSFTSSYFSSFEKLQSNLLKNVVYFQFISAALFFFYQIIFWNFIYKDKQYVSKSANK